MAKEGKDPLTRGMECFVDRAFIGNILNSNISVLSQDIAKFPFVIQQSAMESIKL